MHFLYILDCDNTHYYVGVTGNLEKRLKDHQSKQSPHTKRYSNINLVYKEEYPTRKLAEKREIQLKGWSREKKNALIEGNIKRLQKLSKSKS